MGQIVIEPAKNIEIPEAAVLLSRAFMPTPVVAGQSTIHNNHIGILVR